MIIEIDNKSGFCFGVVNAIKIAEESLKIGKQLYSLGNIVHNEAEIERLKKMGLKTISHSEFFSLADCKVLIRAHGEPPSTYKYAAENNIELVEATCPVVLKLQQRVKLADEKMQKINGQIVIFGHKGHAEINGLIGQTLNEVILIENKTELNKIDFHRPIVLFSQTTKSVDDFREIAQIIKDKSKYGNYEIHDTVCRQVSNRMPHLKEFAKRFELIIFVGGKQSSNAKVLFDICLKENNNSKFISLAEELKIEWFSGIKSVGICGATSTPQWLMNDVAQEIKNQAINF